MDEEKRRGKGNKRRGEGLTYVVSLEIATLYHEPRNNSVKECTLIPEIFGEGFTVYFLRAVVWCDRRQYCK
jgi:hypothetical protein